MVCRPFQQVQHMKSRIDMPASVNYNKTTRNHIVSILFIEQDRKCSQTINLFDIRVTTKVIGTISTSVTTAVTVFVETKAVGNRQVDCRILCPIAG